ncbi:MAG: aldo/keto reductase [Myxococcota bacterium]
MNISIEKRALGKTGLFATPVGFGGIPIQRLDEEGAVAVVRECVANGINFIDSARAYSDSERKIGLALKRWNLRGKVILASKSMGRDYRSMMADIERSLSEFGTDYIDLYQTHNPTQEGELERVLASDGAIKALREMKKRGAIGHIGITGHNLDRLRDALKTGEFEAVQYPHNNIETTCEEKLIPTARALGIGTIAMKPCGGGAVSNVPLTLRYVLSRGSDIAIPGMDAEEQIKRNLSAAAPLIAPNDGELARLRKEFEELGSRFCRRCGYCLPCEQLLNIPFLLLLPTYSRRYNLHKWASERLDALEKRYADCIECGECETRCPYNLPIRDMLKEAAEIFR